MLCEGDIERFKDTPAISIRKKKKLSLTLPSNKKCQPSFKSRKVGKSLLQIFALLPCVCRKVSIISDASRSVKSLIDSWAVRFMEEMDYTLEANNADRFATEMAAHKTLGSAIKVPTVSALDCRQRL